MTTIIPENYILPNTAIAATSDDESIFKYFQLYNGKLVEVESMSPDGEKWTSKTIEVTPWEPAKLFTPLAAVAFFGLGAKRYLFYLDHENFINDLVYDEHHKHDKHGKWKVGNLKKLKVVTADYSKLAAVTIDGTIYVFYQTGDKKGDIRHVVGSNDQWKSDVNNFGNPPLHGNLPFHGNPPLYGTSLAAVAPEAGISPPGHIPVVFLQDYNLKLAKLVGEDSRELKPIFPKLSPHTPLAAAEDGNNAYLFYTSDENEIRWVTINKKGQEIGPFSLQPTTPKGNIAVVIWKGKLLSDEKIVVFFQPQTSNTITQATAGPEPTPTPFAAAWFTLTGTGEKRVLSAPIIKDVVLHVE